MYTEERSDNTGRLDNQSSAGEPFQFTDFSLLPSNTYLKSHWQAMYKTVNNANFALKGIQTVTFSDEKDYRGTMPQFQKEAYQTNQQLFEMIRTISKEKNCTPAQLSLAWMINKKPYIIPIPGTRKSTRLKENLDAANILLTKEEIAKIDAILDKIPMSSLYGRK